MASSINASTSGAGGVITTADNTGILNIQTGGTTAITVDASQNVLIGATSVSGFDSGADNLIVGNGSGSNGLTIYTGTSGVGTINFADGNSGSAIYAGGINYNHSNNKMSFYTTDGSGRMVIDTNGNVGIGISNPGSRLDVRASGTNGIDVRTTGVEDGIYGVFNTGGSSSTVVYVFPMRFGSTSTFIGGIYYNGSVLSLQGTSDERLKENIVDSSSGLDKLKNIKVRSFDWKDGRGHVDFGVIAQELNEIAPEAVVVGKDNEDGTIETPWSADASLLVPVLIKAIQEQQTIINDLKARIETLEAK